MFSSIFQIFWGYKHSNPRYSSRILGGRSNVSWKSNVIHFYEKFKMEMRHRLRVAFENEKIIITTLMELRRGVIANPFSGEIYYYLHSVTSVPPYYVFTILYLYKTRF